MQTLIQIQHIETEKSLINYYGLYEKFSKENLINVSIHNADFPLGKSITPSIPRGISKYTTRAQEVNYNYSTA